MTKYPNPYAGRPDGYNPADDEPTACERDEHDFGQFEPIVVYDPYAGDLIETRREERVCRECGKVETRVRLGTGCSAHWKYIGD